MKRLKLFFACLLMAVLSIGQVWAEDVTFTFPSSSNLLGWSADPSPTFESASPARGLAWSKKAMSMTYTLDGYGISHVKVVASTNNAGNYTLSVNGGTGQAVTKDNNKDYDFDVEVADGGTVTISTTYTGSGKSFWIKSIVFTKASSGGTVAVTGVSLNKSETTLEVGANETLTATVEPSGATNKNVSWSSDDEAVATVVGGVITAVAEGTATITVTTEDGSFTDDCEVTVTAVQPKITITQAEIASFAGSYAEYTWTANTISGKVYAYKNAGIQFNSSKAGYYIYNTDPIPGSIRKITMTATGSARTWTPYVSTSAMTEPVAEKALAAQSVSSTTTWNVTGDNTYFYLTLSGGATVISSIVIEYEVGGGSSVSTPSITGTDNFFTSTEITMTCGTEGAAIYYTTDATLGAGDPSTSTWTLYNSAEKPSIDATTTIYAAAKKDDDWSGKANATFNKATVLTVAQALTAIDALADNGTIENQYVSGVISQIDGYNSTYHSITYWISADGTTTNQLEVYSGKGLNGADFSAVSDLNVGDDVTVSGTLKKYVKNSVTTPEFIQNNVIVARKPIARLAWSGTTEGAYAASLEGGNTFPTLTNSDGVSVSYSSSETSYASFSDASDYSTLTLNAVGSTVITATFAGNSSFKANSASYTLNVSSSVIKADISFECNGAVSCPDGILAASNLPSPLPTVTKAGKNFGGWFTDSEFNTPAVAGDAVTSTDPITLYAKWLEPYTVAEALAIIDALADNGTIEGQYVSGVISQVDSYNNTYHSITYWISADGTTTSQLEVYSGLIGNAATPLGKEAFDAADNLQVGDEVVVFGTLKKYVKNETTTPEFDKNNTIYSFNRPAVAVTGVTVESTASVAVGKTINLSASVLPANATNKTINWSVQSGSEYASVADGVVTGIAEGTAVVRATSAADATKYAECTVTVAPLSPWASVYTSNVTLAAGSNAQSSKVRFTAEGTQYDAVKAGTGKAGGSITVTVPAQATALHLHVVGWSGENPTVTITAPTGVTVTPASISATADAGLSSNSPFTLQNDPVDQYLALSLSGNTEEIELTFSTDAGNKRFALYGVNQEGAVVLESISITGEATALEYNDGDHFSPAGLGVTGTYSDASTAPITEGISWSFDPDPLTEGTTSVSVTATAGGKTSSAFVVNGLTVGAPAPLSPWATTWTSNLADITGAKVKFDGEETEYDALKAGTSGVAGEATINVPAQATALHLHAYGWKGETVTLSITAPAGVTVTPSSIELNSNTGMTSNSPFTLAEGSTPQTDAYYAITLSGNTEAADLTFTATSGKRFVLFGVNQEGGILPVLKSIEIAGDLTKKSGYKAGDALDLDGLTVSAIYTLNDVDQAPVDVTSLVNWSYDPLVEGQTSVTITATLEDKTDDITISDLEPVASADPAIYVNPSLYVNFGSVDKDAALPENKTITVTLTNVAAATATLGGTNPEAFGIDKTALAEGANVITISVASTATAGSFSATITLTDNATENPAPTKTVNLSLTVNEPSDEETPVGTDTKWVAATEIVDGMHVLIVGVNNTDYYAMGAQSGTGGTGNNRVAVAASVDGEGVLTPGENTMSFTLVAQGDGTYAIKTSNDKYLYAAASGNNYLKTQDEVDVNAKWTMTVASASAEGSSNRHVMQFNSGSTLFSCYNTASQKPIAIYVPKPVTPTTYSVNIATGIEHGTVAADPTSAEEGATITLTITPADGYELSTLSVTGDVSGDEVTVTSNQFSMPAEGVTVSATFSLIPTPTPDYTRGVTVGNYGTICLPNGGNISGAKLFDLEYYDGGASTLYLLEVEGSAMEAGRPYIFLPSVATIEVFYTDDADADAGSNKGLIGWLGNENKLIDPDAGNYILYQSQYWFVNSEAYVTPNHAYIHMDDVPTEPLTPAPGAAPRRRVAMAVNGENAATGFENIESGDAPMKVMIDGTMYILRGEKVYDATGRLVK